MKPLWKDPDTKALLKILLVVFVTALTMRTSVALVFHGRHGVHATNGVEFWFYYGLAQGRFSLPYAWDPAMWTLRPLGRLFDAEALVVALHVVTAVLDSLNAVLMALLAARLHGRRAAFFAGILYASSVPAMFNSAATLTHDVFGYGWLFMALLGAIVLLEGRLTLRATSPGKAGHPLLIRLGGGSLMILSLFIASRIGPVVVITVATLTVYAAWHALRAGMGPKRAKNRSFVFGMFLAGLFLCALLVHFMVMPRFMEWIIGLAKSMRGLDIRAQMQAGAGDVMATSPGDYWLRFNFMLFFLPMSLYAAFKRRDSITWGLLVFGLLACWTADRGTRLLMPGMVLCTTLAMVEWRNRDLWVLIPWTLFVLRVVHNSNALHPAIYFSTSIFFALTAVELWAVLMWSRRTAWEWLRSPGIAAICWLFAVIIVRTNLSVSTTEGEYLAYRQLEKQTQGDGKIMVTCFEGYFAEAISGLTSAVSPERIDFDLEQVFWRNEQEAVSLLRSHGIRYLACSGKHYAGFSPESRDHVRVAVQSTLRQVAPGPVLPVKDWENMLLYKLYHRPKSLTSIRPVPLDTGQAGPADLLVFEIMPDSPSK